MKQVLFISMQLVDARDFVETISETKTEIIKYIGQRSVINMCTEDQFMVVDGVTILDLDYLNQKVPKCVKLTLLQTETEFPKCQIWDIKS